MADQQIVLYVVWRGPFRAADAASELTWRTRVETQKYFTRHAGRVDPSRKDINYTEFEVTLYDLWRKQYTLKLKLKPTVDWIQDGDTGGVGELEVGMFFARDWRTWLMFGRRLWGPSSIQRTYSDRVEFGINHTS